MSNDFSRTGRLAELSRISDETFAAHADAGVRDELLGAVLSESIGAPDGPRRRHRAPLIAAASATTVLAGSAIGWAITSSGATDTVSVQCEINGNDSVIPATSGDPVTDCAAQWQRETGTAAPDLVAYDNGHGGITVAPASQEPEPRSTPLPPGTTQNLSAITLQENLDDYIAGLNAGCRTNDEAVALARQQLDAAGLDGWTVAAPPESADGTTLCADTAIVDAATRTVTLRALGGASPADAPYVELARQLRQLSGCSTAGQLERRVRATAEQIGLSEAAHEFQLTTVTTSARCSVVHETVGGTIFLTVRGPAS